MIFDPKGRHAGIAGFFKLLKEIRKERFHIVVVLESHWKIAAALFFSRVPSRIGPWSQLHSFLFYNLGVRQRRSHVEMHETDYNLQLLKRLQIRVGSRSIPTQVSISRSTRQKARIWLQKKGWNPEKKLIIIHPGMNGSALNWPASHYEDLVIELLKNQKQLLLSGGPHDAPILDKIKTRIEDWKKEHTLSLEPMFYYGDYPIDFLGGLFHFSDLVVAPSAGPMHLAVALGRPAVTFYSPVRVQSAIRWGPYLHDEKNVSILVPEVYCGQDFRCLGSPCHYYPCMKGLTLNQTLTEIKQQLGETQRL
jgi:ADP-heptose:LPS heptosyltransferase